MAGRQEARDRAVGVWGPAAYTWTGEERQRAAGFPIDPSGRQRVLGFPPDSSEVVKGDWHRTFAHVVRGFRRLRARLGGQPERGLRDRQRSW
jgi:hypothetical protein